MKDEWKKEQGVRLLKREQPQRQRSGERNSCVRHKEQNRRMAGA